MRIYKHYRPKVVMLPLIIMAILGAVGFVGLVWGIRRGVNSEPPPFIFLFLIVAAVGNGWVFGGFAIEARLAEDGYVEFIGPLRKVRIAVLDILSIAPSEMSQMSTYVVRHRNGRFRVDGRLNGMHELISELKRQNPTIELRGI
jgi:hypothetical protein